MADIDNQIKSIQERMQAAEDSGLEDEVKAFQEDINFLNTIKAGQEAEAKAAEAPKAPEEAATPKAEPEAKPEEKPLDPRELARQVEDERVKLQKYRELAEKRNTRVDLVETALESKESTFEGTDEEYLDSIGLGANKPFESAVKADPLDAVMGDRKFTDKELSDPAFAEKNEELLDKMQEIDPSAAGNIRSDHRERSGITQRIELENGWRDGWTQEDRKLAGIEDFDSESPRDNSTV